MSLLVEPTPSKTATVRVLILTCGNNLREDDGLGPRIGDWALAKFGSVDGIRVINQRQWTVELAEDISWATHVAFVDCAVDISPGTIHIARLAPFTFRPPRFSHHLDAPCLLTAAKENYGAFPLDARLITVGAGSLGHGDRLSSAVEESLIEVHRLIDEFISEALLPR